jgi:hypothetical protein
LPPLAVILSQAGLPSGWTIFVLMPVRLTPL